MGCRSPLCETNADAPPQAPRLSERPDERPMGRDEPMIPEAAPGGRPRCAPKREIVEAILYLLRAGCSWRLLPHDFPPWQTVYHYLRRWEREGVWARVHHMLVMADAALSATRKSSSRRTFAGVLALAVLAMW
jgi:transposase